MAELPKRHPPQAMPRFGSTRKRAVLRVEALEVDIASASILRDVHLHVPARSLCGLIGRNGAGKTTFMRSVMGLVRLRGGRIYFDNTELNQVRAHKRAGLGIGYMPEDRRLVPEFTAEENVLLPAWSTRLETPSSGWPGSTASCPRSSTSPTSGRSSSAAASKSWWPWHGR